MKLFYNMSFNNNSYFGRGAKLQVYHYVYFIFIYFILLIDVFFDVVRFQISNGFRRSHVVFEL